MTIIEFKNRADVLKNYLKTIQNEVSKNAVDAEEFIEKNDVHFRAYSYGGMSIYKAYYVNLENGIISGKTDNNSKLYSFYIDTVEFI